MSTPSDRRRLTLIKSTVDLRAFAFGMGLAIAFMSAVVAVYLLVDPIAGIILGGIGVAGDLVLTYLVNRKRE